MKTFSRLFRTKFTAQTIHAEYSNLATSDALPGEVAAAIDAAVITVRAFSDSPNALDDSRTIIEFQGLPGIKFDRARLASFFAAEWKLNERQVKRAVRYLENRCIAEARRLGEAHAVIASSRKRWSASQW